MTWSDVDDHFIEFLDCWLKNIAPFYHSDEKDAEKPSIEGLLENHFEYLYPAQFILRLTQIADLERQSWLLSSINTRQQQILLEWIADSHHDFLKGFIADNWSQELPKDIVTYEGVDITSPLRSYIFQQLSNHSKKLSKKLR
ncbi:hypothetical protein BFW38_12150 [Terasakiispira papahanaumokuakeensis]|uniref:Uncharacterized protein n=1 Tax=Terasakiispira papahanaumokuakeensis TaxID=197479 RepID=A0A1E2VBF1_9GAMM|nr:hypothetical protein [Terasakiispira papahanaumokuakeensis]ODC04166.1 hypothetical protein BFW38_12150 [Terasakiispira papahanaumokuakeensis]